MISIDNYSKLVEEVTPKENKWKNVIYAFISGGLIGSASELLVYFFNSEIMITIWIVIASILTGMGIMDNFVEKFKMGIVIPITGFSHSVTSSSLDYKYDGFITGIGSNFFKLAGSVILYGIVASTILLIIKGILCLV